MPDVTQLGVQLESTGAAQVVRELGHVDDAVKRTGQSVTQFGLSAGAASAVVTQALHTLGQAAGAALSAVGAATVGMNSKLEQSSIAFTTMLGSAEAAGAFLKDLQQFAATTPFEFPELVKASQRMLAFGFSAAEVRPTLTAIGNSVASFGGGAAEIDRVTTALGQMQAKGRVQGDEMLQLTEAGINGYRILAEAMGTDVATAMDKVSKGQVQASTFIQAFIQDSNARLGGMMEAQSRTFAGALSTLKDVVGQTVGGAFKPFFDVISSITVRLADFAQSETVSVWAQDLGIRLGALAPLFGQIADWLTAQLPAAMSAAEAATAGFVQGVQAVAGAWDDLRARLQTGADTLAAPVQAVVGSFQAMVQGIEQATADTDGTVTPVLARIAGFLTDVLMPANAAFQQAWQAVWQQVQISTVTAINAVLPPLEQARAWFADTILPAVEGFRSGFSEAMATIGPAASAMWAVVGPILALLEAALLSGVVLAAKTVADNMGNMLRVIGEGFNQLGTFLRPLADLLGGAIKDAVDAMTVEWVALSPQVAHAAEESGEQVRQAFVKGTAPLAQDVAAVAAPAATAVAQVGTAASTAATVGLLPLADASKKAKTELEAMRDGIKELTTATDAGSVAQGRWEQFLDSFTTGTLSKTTAGIAATSQAMLNQGDLWGAATNQAAALGLSVDTLSAAYWGDEAAIKAVTDAQRGLIAAQDDAATALRKLDAEARRAQENALAERVMAGELTRAEAAKELDAWRKAYEGVEAAAKSTATGVTAATTQMGGHLATVATSTEAAASRTVGALASMASAARATAGTMGGGIPVEDFIDRLAGFAPKPVETRKGGGGPGGIPSGRVIREYLGGQIMSPEGLSESELEAWLRKFRDDENRKALAIAEQGRRGGLTRRPIDQLLDPFGAGDASQAPPFMTQSGGLSGMADTTTRAFEQVEHAGTRAFDGIGDAARDAGFMVSQMAYALSGQAAQAFLVLEQHMTVLKQRAQDLMAGIQRTAFGTTSTGLNASQIYGGTATNAGQQQPTSMYGIPIFSPITPGTLRGYATGGTVMEPHYLTNARTGRTDGIMAERGPERIGNGGTTVNVTLAIQTPAVSFAPQHEIRQAVEAAGPTLVNYLREVL